MSTARLRTYGAAALAVDGQYQVFGTMDAPVGEVEYVHGGTFNPRSGLILTGNSTGLYQGSINEDRLRFLQFRIIGEGTVILSIMTDLPTDAASDDWTATGTQVRWQHIPWTCNMGLFTLNTDETFGLADASHEYADAAGLPALWTTYVASLVTKRIYKVYVYNPDIEEDVAFEALVLTRRE